MKNSLERVNIKLTMQKEETMNCKTIHLKSLSQEQNRKKKRRKLKRAYRTYRTPSSGPTYELWESQIDKKERAESLFEEIIVKNLENLRKEVDIQI